MPRSSLKMLVKDLASDMGRFFQSMQASVKSAIPVNDLEAQQRARLMDDRNEGDLWRFLFAYINALESDSTTAHQVSIYNQRLASYGRIKMLAQSEVSKPKFINALNDEIRSSTSLLSKASTGRLGSCRFATLLQEMREGLIAEKFTMTSLTQSLEETEHDRNSMQLYPSSPRYND